MNDYFNSLEENFKAEANTVRAQQQSAYMRNQFAFFGLTSPERKLLSRPFLLRESLAPKSELKKSVEYLFSKDERDFQHFALDLAYKYIKLQEINDIEIYEHMILNKSWWDTIDFIAPKLVAQYFINFPEQRDVCVNKWIESNNIWLQRSAILFQLKYKDKMDTVFLEYVINKLNGGNEFFINKAIGWILREHAKLDSNWVIDFVDRTELSNLSRREALKHFS